MFRLIPNNVLFDCEQHSGASRTKKHKLLIATLGTYKPSVKFLSYDYTRRSYADKEVDHAQNQRNSTIKIRLQTHLWTNSCKLRNRRTTVSDYLKRFEMSPLQYPLASDVDDTQLEQILFPSARLNLSRIEPALTGNIFTVSFEEKVSP